RHAKSFRETLEHRRLSVLSDQQMLDRLGGAPSGSLADLERLLASGRYDLFEGNLGRAERSLTASVHDAASLPASDERWTDESEAYALLAWLRAQQGNLPEAKKAIAHVLRVEPSYSPKKDAFPPSFRKQVDEIGRAHV